MCRKPSKARRTASIVFSGGIFSVALGGKRDVGTWAGGHPFDLELTRMPADARNYPLHQHSAQWELYVFLAGFGEMTDGKEKITVRAARRRALPA